MNLDILRYNLRNTTDIEVLRERAILLTTLIGSNGGSGGYCVVNDHNPPYSLHNGTRENCLAFIDGYESAPTTDVGCFDTSVLCVCVDVPSRMIVVPEERFGEALCGSCGDG